MFRCFKKYLVYIYEILHKCFSKNLKLFDPEISVLGVLFMHVYAFYHIGIYDRFPYCGKLHFSKLDVMVLSPDMLFCEVVWTFLHQKVKSVPLPSNVGFF